MKRKKRFFMALLVVGALLLSACGAAQDPPEDAGAGAGSAGQGSSEAEQAASAEFESEIPDTSPGTEKAQEEDLWSGVYIMEEEAVTLSKTDDRTISFSFAQAGISGAAALDGARAVYRGDDNYLVVFQVSGTVLDVSVSSEGGDDASGSPLNGSYIKEVS